MKIKLPAPIKLHLGQTTVEYSLPEMVRHFARNGREASRTEEDARAWKRILAAFENPEGGEVEIGEKDAQRLREMAKKPSCGWGRHEVVLKGTMRGPDGQPVEREVKRFGQAPAMDYLPLIDALPNG